MRPTRIGADMSERTDTHIRLFYVLPEEERDGFRALPDEAKKTWRNALLGTEQLDDVGERGHYTVALTDDERERANRARNVEYAIPATTAHTHGDPQDVEVVARAGEYELESESEAEAEVETEATIRSFVFPDPATMVYHNAKGTEKNRNAGKGFVVWHLDTGASKVMEEMTPGGIVFRKNYTGGDPNDTTDRQGHGSLTLSLAVPMGASAAICKVLGDDGSGSSVGIVAAIRDAAKYAREKPALKGKIILTGSLGGAPGQRFQPYVDACYEAEEAGVLCLWSAGNDGVNAIAAPANWRENRASIAFYRPTDRRASFSNYDDTAGLATEGQQILMIDSHGNLVRGNGTSFSLPVWVRHIVVGAWIRSTGVFKMFRSTLATARGSEEPVEEEAHGVLDLWKAINKLRK